MVDFSMLYIHLNVLLAVLSAALIWILLTLGQDIRWGRLARGLSQEKLAELLEVHPRTVQRWERDEMVPRAYHMNRLKDLRILDEFHVNHFAGHGSNENYPEKFSSYPQILLLNACEGGLDG